MRPNPALIAAFLLELLCCTTFLNSCTLFFGEPIPLTDYEVEALESVFTADAVDYMKERVFLDPGIPQESCYYPGLQMILVRTDFRQASISGLIMVHEFTHYYQDVFLGRAMTVSNNIDDYTIPADLSARVNIEAEAELVRTVVLNLMNSGSASADQIAYLKDFMGLQVDTSGRLYAKVRQ